MNKKTLIAIITFIFLAIILKAVLSTNKTVTSNIKNACTCFHQGYNSGLRGGSKNLNGCYKGYDGNTNIRKAWNEGYWYGQKAAQGANIKVEYRNYQGKYCN